MLAMSYIGKHSGGAMVPVQVRPLPPLPPEPDPPEITVANAIAWLRAEVSLRIHGPVSDDVAEARIAACLNCDERRQKLSNPDGIGWCGACKCGGAEKARLSRKVQMPAATCPKGRWAAQ